MPLCPVCWTKKLKLSCSFRCVQIHVNHGYKFSHTLLLCSSTTWMIIKPASDIPTQRGINLFFSDCSAGKSPSFAGVPAHSEELPDRWTGPDWDCDPVAKVPAWTGDSPLAAWGWSWKWSDGILQGILKGRYHCTIDLLFGLESAVWLLTIFVFICKTD